MIYLTNDALDQAVYFEKRNGRALRSGNGCHFGVVGNGTFETAVDPQRWEGPYGDRLRQEFALYRRGRGSGAPAARRAGGRGDGALTGREGGETLPRGLRVNVTDQQGGKSMEPMVVAALGIVIYCGYLTLCDLAEDLEREGFRIPSRSKATGRLAWISTEHKLPNTYHIPH